MAGSLLPTRTKLLLGTMRRDVILALPGWNVHVNVHRTLHMLAFGVAAWLLVRIAHTPRARALMALVVCALALSAEAGESLVFHNRMEWPDVIDDFVGIAAGLLAGCLKRAL